MLIICEHLIIYRASTASFTFYLLSSKIHISNSSQKTYRQINATRFSSVIPYRLSIKVVRKSNHLLTPSKKHSFKSIALSESGTEF